MPDLVIRTEPFDPILMITHFVRTPLLSNSFPAAIGFRKPVIDSAWSDKQYIRPKMQNPMVQELTKFIYKCYGTLCKLTISVV